MLSKFEWVVVVASFNVFFFFMLLPTIILSMFLTVTIIVIVLIVQVHSFHQITCLGFNENMWITLTCTQDA